MAATPATCVFCRRGLPHERHVTQLEYLRIFGEMDTYVNDVRVLDQSGVHGVVSVAAKERVAS